MKTLWCQFDKRQRHLSFSPYHNIQINIFLPHFDDNPLYRPSLLSALLPTAIESLVTVLFD